MVIMESIRVDDIDVCFTRKGSGPPLVMIMGLTANLDWWAPPLLEALAERFELLLFDNRGAGRSSTGNRPFSMKQFAADTAGLMRALGIERANVMGASMGGMISQELALGWPRMVERLVLCCTACGGLHAKLPSFEALKTLFTPRAPDPVEQARRSLPILFPEPWLSQHPEIGETFAETVAKAPIGKENAQKQIGAVMRFNTYRRLPCITRRTLVTCGLRDVLIPPENALLLARRIPGARLKIFEDAGHGFTTQCAAGVAQEVVEFLGEQPGGDVPAGLS
jgi:3-oxoadipate enol-lactonase